MAVTAPSAAMRETRSKRKATVDAAREVASRVLSSPDILHLILPQLNLRAFIAVRCTCKEMRAATQSVCEDLIAVLERASQLYVSPRFADALELIAAHQPHICWLLQARAATTAAPAAHTPALARTHTPTAHTRAYAHTHGTARTHEHGRRMRTSGHMHENRIPHPLSHCLHLHRRGVADAPHTHNPTIHPPTPHAPTPTHHQLIRPPPPPPIIRSRPSWLSSPSTLHDLP